MKKASACLALCFLAAATQGLAGDALVKNGEKLAFLGDSITQQGAGQPSGYAKLAVAGLEANGIKVEPVFAGIGGNKSNDMLARVEKDVLDKKPDVMTLNCGVNDVWAGAKGIDLETYKKNIGEIMDKAKAANVRVILLTPTLLGEDPNSDGNKKLAGYAEAMRELAKEKGVDLIDLNILMRETLKKLKEENAPKTSGSSYLTSDGVHMMPPGNLMMAEGVLRGMGLDDAQIAKAKAAWNETPGAVKLSANGAMSLKDYEKFAAEAAKEGMSVTERADKICAETLEKLAQSPEASK